VDSPPESAGILEFRLIPADSPRNTWNPGGISGGMKSIVVVVVIVVAVITVVVIVVVVVAVVAIVVVVVVVAIVGDVAAALHGFMVSEWEMG